MVLSIGGAVGVNARYWLGAWVDGRFGPRFPWSTFSINVSGSFAIGIVSVILAHRGPQPLARLFFVTGFLGGYTTFSAFSLESHALWGRGDRGLAVVNALGSVAAGLLAVTVGVALGRAIVGPSADLDRAARVESANPADRPSGRGGP